MIEISFLENRPLSGVCDEFEFTRANELLWVKFVEDSYEAWIGKFELGMKKDKCRISQINSSSCVAILSGGIINVLNYDKKALLTASKNDYFEDILYMPSLNVLLATDGLSISILDPISLEVKWASKRVSWDGITFDRLEHRLVFGTLNDLSDEGAKFEFDATNRALKTKYKFELLDS